MNKMLDWISIWNLASSFGPTFTSSWTKWVSCCSLLMLQSTLWLLRLIRLVVFFKTITKSLCYVDSAWNRRKMALRKDLSHKWLAKTNQKKTFLDYKSCNKCQTPEEHFCRGFFDSLVDQGLFSINNRVFRKIQLRILSKFRTFSINIFILSALMSFRLWS